MTIESPTQTEVPTPTEVIQETATEESAAAPEPSAEPEEAAPVFAKIGDRTFKDDYELVESDIVQPHFQRQMEREKGKIQQDYEERFTAATKSWEATNTYRSLAGHMGSVLEKINDGDVDGAEKILGRIEALVEPLSDTYQQNLKVEGGREAARVQMKAAIDSIPDRRARDQFEDWLSSGNRSWEDFYKKLGATHGDLKDKQAYERGLKDGREGKEASMKAEERSKPGAGPDATPAKSGSGGLNSMDDADRRYNLPPSDPEHITHEQYKQARERYLK